MNPTRENPPTSPNQPRNAWLAAAVALVALAPAVSALATGPTLGEARIDASFLAQLHGDRAGRHDAFFTLADRPDASDGALLESAGLDILRVFPDFNVVFVQGTGVDLLRAATLPGVLNVQGNDVLEYHSSTALLSSRVRDVWDDKSTSTTPVTVGGSVVDGTGVTVVVVDSGVDTLHPDLAGITLNKKFVCTTPGLVATASNTCYGNAVVFSQTGCVNGLPSWVNADNSEVTSGHGTHVAGILAGSGAVSGGRFMGAAPGATVIGLGVGEVISILFALEAFNWVNCQAATYGIDIVTNSWGAAGAYNPLDPVNVAVNALVAKGITVVFSAGNDAAATTTSTVNRYARNPTAGVIGVASIDDGGQAQRDNATVSSFSSGCLATSTYDECPDVAAPGSDITAAQSSAGPVVVALDVADGDPELNYRPYYASISGTSMAAPQVAGIAALLKQANPALTPAQIEDVIKDTAFEFEPAAAYSIADTANGGLMSVGSGHGLVDAIAALESVPVLNTTGLGSAQPLVGVTPHVYVGVAGAGADGQLVGGVQWTVPAGFTVALSERNMRYSDSWIMSVGQACEFEVYQGGSLVATVACGWGGVRADTAPAFRMDANYTFASAGTYDIEPQATFGGTEFAVDRFRVTVA